VTNISSNGTAFANIGQAVAANVDQYYYQPPRAVTGDITFQF
jgi:hypothetical protein